MCRLVGPCGPNVSMGVSLQVPDYRPSCLVLHHWPTSRVLSSTFVPVLPATLYAIAGLMAKPPLHFGVVSLTLPE